MHAFQGRIESRLTIISDTYLHVHGLCSHRLSISAVYSMSVPTQPFLEHINSKCRYAVMIQLFPSFQRRQWRVWSSEVFVPNILVFVNMFTVCLLLHRCVSRNCWSVAVGVMERKQSSPSSLMPLTCLSAACKPNCLADADLHVYVQNGLQLHAQVKYNA